MAPIANTKTVDPNNKHTGMALLHEEENDHNHKDKKKEQGLEDRYSSEPEKAHPTGEFVIVAKFGGHVLHHFASRLAKCDQVGREAD